MGMIYFPSCKVTAGLPNASKKIQEYLKERFTAKVVGCCRPGHKQLTQEDQVAFVCNTCRAICSEDSSAESLISVWELIDQDENFVFPDYQNKRMTIQDCWRVAENRSQQEAVRSILRKMNIQIVELAENFAKTRYCGASLYQPLPKQNGEFAPKRFIENAKGMFLDCSEEEQMQKMKEHCTQIETEEVVSYCVACVKGHEMGGKKGIHLLNLLYPNS